jgi:hypothetical protein
MKIGISDPDVPRDQTVRSNVDFLLSHDERAIQQSEIADCACAVFSDGERAAGVTGSMFADHNCLLSLTTEMAKNLRGLAIKAFAKLHVRGDRMRPPITLHMSIRLNVAHFG